METRTEQKLEEWRGLAAKMRADAPNSEMPGMSEKLLRAAQDLEHYADMLSISAR